MIRNAGLFLLLIGLGMLVGTLLGGDEPVNRSVFFAGTGLGIAALFVFGRRLSYGTPSLLQLTMLVAAMLLEVCSLGTFSLVLADASPRDYWLWTLLVVGILFVPMAVAFGPRMALLAALCIVNAILGIVSGTVPCLFSGAADLILKMLFGASMLIARPSRDAPM